MQRERVRSLVSVEGGADDWLVDETVIGLGGEGRSQDDSEVFGLSHWRKELPLTEQKETAGGAGVAGERVGKLKFRSKHFKLEMPLRYPSGDAKEVTGW